MPSKRRNSDDDTANSGGDAPTSNGGASPFFLAGAALLGFGVALLLTNKAAVDEFQDARRAFDSQILANCPAEWLNYQKILVDKVEELETKLAKAEEAVKPCADKLEDKEKELEKVEKNLANEKKSHQETEDQLSKKVEEIGQLSRLIESKTKEGETAAILTDQIRHHQEHTRECHTELEQCRRKAISDLADSNGKRLQAEEALSKVEIALATTTQRLQQTMDTCDAEELAQLREKTQGLDHKLQDYKGTLVTVAGQVHEMDQQIYKLKNENQELEKEARQAQQATIEAQEASMKAQRELQEAQDSVVTLEANLDLLKADLTKAQSPDAILNSFMVVSRSLSVVQIEVKEATEAGGHALTTVRTARIEMDDVMAEVDQSKQQIEKVSNVAGNRKQG